MRLIYPVPVEKWIVRQSGDGQLLSRRKSPRKGRLEHVFLELIRIPRLITEQNFSIQVVMVREEEIQADDGRGSWRRLGRSILDRRLIEVIETVTFNTPTDFGRLLPADLPETFSASDLRAAIGGPLTLARKMVYCLSRMGVIDPAGKRGRAYLYRKA